MKNCPGCNKKVKWYHKKGGGQFEYNSSWHRQCAASAKRSYDIAYKHCSEMNDMYGLPAPHELYWLHQPPAQPESIGIPLMKNFKEKYNIGNDNKIQMKNLFQEIICYLKNAFTNGKL